MHHAKHGEVTGLSGPPEISLNIIPHFYFHLLHRLISPIPPLDYPRWSLIARADKMRTFVT